MKRQNCPIGVFDSGVGGLSVLRHLLRLMPNEQYIYLGDTARVPYGNKSKETITQYSRQCVDFLMEREVKLIVVACNTASATALEELQQRSSAPVLGMIAPAARAALRKTKNGNIGVIGTRATINSNAYSDALRIIQSVTYSPSTKPIQIHSQPCPLFVPLAEEALYDHPASELIARDYLAPLKAAEADTLILGCTHYPTLIPLLNKIVPEMSLIDCGEHVAEISKEILLHSNLLKDDTVDIPDIQLYTTDISPTFEKVAEYFLGFRVPQIQQASIDSTTEFPQPIRVHSSDLHYGTTT